MSDYGSEDEVALDLSNSDVVTRYKASAEICNKAMAAVIAECKAGAKIVDVCNAGDNLINKEVALIFKGKDIEKGVAFPTCVSVNSVVGHFSPMADDATTLKDGDVVKIDMGCHIDGFVATQAQTIVVQGSDAPVTGRAADVIQCARACHDAALRLIRPGKKVSEVAPILQTIAEAYGCNVVEGVMTHEMKQFVMDGNKCVLNKPSPEHRVEDAEFEENEVYAVDIVISTGEGKPKVQDEKETTVYKRALDVEYQLKMKASRAVLSEINRKYPALPFTIRALLAEDKDLQKQLRLGLVECLNHGLLYPYPVMHEKQGDLVAQVKSTVLLMPNGSDVVTKATTQAVQSEKSCTDAEVAALMTQSLKSAKKKNKKKKDKEAPALV
jgi:curved DNA binding protein